MIRSLLTAIVLVGIGGSARADQINGLVTDPPPMLDPLKVGPIGETLATITDSGAVTFNWPAIERCAAEDPTKPIDANRTALDCRLWLAARRDGATK